METLPTFDMTITAGARRAIAERWGTDQSDLHVVEVSGGYTRNRRSLVNVKGEWIFAKEVDLSLLPGDGLEELAWLEKDYSVTRYLRTQGNRVVPEWGELLEDGNLLLLPAYRKEDGWHWKVPKTEAEQSTYITGVLAALKELEAFSPSSEVLRKLNLQPYFRDKLAFDEGLNQLLEHEAIFNQVVTKLTSMIDSSGLEKMKQCLEDLRDLFHDPKQLIELVAEGRLLSSQPDECFGHCDTRSDNLAFNLKTGELKFVDWNWASMVPKKFGTTEFLIDVFRQGLDVTPWAADLNKQVLAASIGYYTRRCIKDPPVEGSKLREINAESAAVAYELYRLC